MRYIGIVAVLVLGVAGAAQAGTWTVDILGSGQFTSIQAAINAAAPLDTINVMPGVYSERLNISKPLSLLGAQVGVDPTQSGVRNSLVLEAVITAPGLYANPDVLIDIPTGVNGVTINGFTLRSNASNTNADTCTVRGWGNSLSVGNNIMEGMNGVLYKGGTGLTVSSNRVTVNKSGVVVQPGVSATVTISGNVIGTGSSLQTDPNGVYLTSCTDASVTGNTITGFALSTGGRGVGGSNLTRITVSDNDITGNRDGISFWGNTTFVDIDDNTLTNTRYGINIKGQDIDITNNEIVGNALAGVFIGKDSLTTERVTVTSNNIDNASYGVQVGAGVTAVVEAHGNWWGDATGPLDNKSLPGTPDYNNTGGLGDTVSSYVDYAGWRSQAVPEPATLALLAAGGIATLLRRRRSSKK